MEIEVELTINDLQCETLDKIFRFGNLCIPVLKRVCKHWNKTINDSQYTNNCTIKQIITPNLMTWCLNEHVLETNGSTIREFIAQSTVELIQHLFTLTNIRKKSFYKTCLHIGHVEKFKVVWMNMQTSKNSRKINLCKRIIKTSIYSEEYSIELAHLLSLVGYQYVIKKDKEGKLYEIALAKKEILEKIIEIGFKFPDNIISYVIQHNYRLDIHKILFLIKKGYNMTFEDLLEIFKMYPISDFKLLINLSSFLHEHQLQYVLHYLYHNIHLNDIRELFTLEGREPVELIPFDIRMLNCIANSPNVKCKNSRYGQFEYKVGIAFQKFKILYDIYQFNMNVAVDIFMKTNITQYDFYLFDYLIELDIFNQQLIEHMINLYLMNSYVFAYLYNKIINYIKRFKKVIQPVVISEFYRIDSHGQPESLTISFIMENKLTSFLAKKKLIHRASFPKLFKMIDFKILKYILRYENLDVDARQIGEWIKNNKLELVYGLVHSTNNIKVIFNL